MPKGLTKNNNKDNGKSHTTKSKIDNQISSNEEGNQYHSSNDDTGETINITGEMPQNPKPKIDSLVEESGNDPFDEGYQGIKTSEVTSRSDLNLFIEDVRGTISENTLIDSSSQILPGSPYQINKKLPKFLQVIDNWMYGKVKNPFLPYQPVIGAGKKKRSPLRVIFVLFLFSFLIYLLFLVSKNIKQATPIIIPTITPIPTYAIPVPYSVQFPGGWTFFLGTSSDAFTDWKPNQAEWLKDTTICKLIAIPWTKQIDAVYKTLVPGENITLTMNNKDEAIYHIETLEVSLIEKLIEKLNRNSPCMVIFLYREGTLTAQVLILAPSPP